MPALRPLPRPPVVPQQRTTGAALLAQASPPVVVSDAVTAVVTVQAEDVGGAGVLGAPIVVDGVTATVSVTAPTGTAAVTDGAGSPMFVFDAATALVSVTAPSSGVGYVGSPIAGDAWQAPTTYSSPTGSTTWSTAGHTTTADEPVSSGTFFRSKWFKFTSASGDLNFDVSAGTSVRIDVFDVGSDFSDPTSWRLVDQAFGTAASIQYVFPNASAGVFVRVSATTDTDFSVTMTWASAAAVDPGSAFGDGAALQVYEPVIEIAPSSVTYSIFNLQEDETISVQISPNPLGFTALTNTADDAGIVLGESFELPGELPAGVYTLIATHNQGTSGDTFVVEQAPILHPADINDDDALPDDSPPAGPFTRWTFVDPAGLVADFVFTFNPERMTSPYVPRTFLSESTTSPTGQAQVWEALAPGADWEFAGYVNTEAELETLLSWLDVKRRIWVVDHRQRKWVVALVSIDPQPRRQFATPYSTNYTVKALIFKEGT